MGLKYERQVRLDRGGRQSNCLESRILFLVVHYKELHQMNDCVTHVITIPNPVKTFGEDTPDLMFGGMTIHETVMRFVNWQKQEKKVTI